MLNQRTDEESCNIEVVARESTDELIIAEIKQDSEHDLEQGQEQVRETEIYNQVSSSVSWCKTQMRTVRRQLPIVPPTPINQSMVAMSERLVQEETLMIQNTPKESPRLPAVPTAEATKGTKQMPKGTLQSNTEMTETPPVNIADKHSTPIVNVRRPVGRRVLHERDPDCKQTTYVDARNYGEALTESNELDTITKGYLQGKIQCKDVARVIASESKAKENKRPRTRKEPWMKNRREKRNTRKAKIYQFPQKAYEQNKKATINKIISGNFNLNNEEHVVPKIQEVEKVSIQKPKGYNIR